MDAYQKLGEQMAESGISNTGLEGKINALGTSITPEQAKSVVTGFVDKTLKQRYSSSAELYKLVHGYARWLYNGDFSAARDRVLQKMAAAVVNQRDYSSRNLKELLTERRDVEGINRIAELCIDADPSIATEWVGDKQRRPEFLKRIIEKHKGNKEHRGLIRACLKELDDTDQLREMARSYLTTDCEFALSILEECGTREDYRFAAGALQEKSILHASRAAQQITDWAVKRRSGNDEKDNPEDIALQKKLERLFIETKPLLALKELTSRERGSVRYNKEAVIEIGKILLNSGDLEEAIETFAQAEYHGPEKTEAALRIIKNKGYINFRQPGEYSKGIVCHKVWCALQETALEYFNQDGNPVVADQYLETVRNLDDATLRRLGNALARQKTQDTGTEKRAYARLMSIGKKTPNDLRKIADLRQKILKQDSWAHGLFKTHNDNEGMRACFEMEIASNPQLSYDSAKFLYDQELIEKARQAVIDKESVQNAIDFFKREKDETGINQAKAKVLPEIDREIVEKLLFQ